MIPRVSPESRLPAGLNRPRFSALLQVSFWFMMVIGLFLYSKEIAPLGGISGDRPKFLAGIELGKQQVALIFTYLT